MERDEDGLGFLSVAELRGEVQRLANIVADNGECDIQVYDRMMAAVEKLRLRLQSCNAAVNRDNDNGSPNRRNAIPVKDTPDALLTDAVIVATGPVLVKQHY